MGCTTFSPTVYIPHLLFSGCHVSSFLSYSIADSLPSFKERKSFFTEWTVFSDFILLNAKGRRSAERRPLTIYYSSSWKCYQDYRLLLRYQIFCSCAALINSSRKAGCAMEI